MIAKIRKITSAATRVRKSLHVATEAGARYELTLQKMLAACQAPDFHETPQEDLRTAFINIDESIRRLKSAMKPETRLFAVLAHFQIQHFRRLEQLAEKVKYLLWQQFQRGCVN